MCALNGEYSFWKRNARALKSLTCRFKPEVLANRKVVRCDFCTEVSGIENACTDEQELHRRPAKNG
ncbi:hypothetical protein SAMN05444008_106179 [Cnuella takakiae]|uniref:Uncharacterized protein n=1 Tax=Cnuella takakiae TaxID=1302690 RepID=A0A1M5A9Z4_9BACT|nr:hypothetical protein SAMN05444008_106179 [Cnuella takakiae]